MYTDQFNINSFTIKLCHIRICVIILKWSIRLIITCFIIVACLALFDTWHFPFIHSNFALDSKMVDILMIITMFKWTEFKIPSNSRVEVVGITERTSLETWFLMRYLLRVPKLEHEKEGSSTPR